ncbi:uncharacterized protein LOC121729866 [Aricia agestis]|uniref:uncharacterized protein LOC121729866 n=1 Tax=Aricia agestis TaxID=91739 RepID=UPI001C207FD3|nr:uncharacterized protein LOC121729866 [Aricia agestis]
MVEKSEVKAESLLNLDDLLQCPVCYEIPTGQIFQCNEGHHVCGRCKMRLDVCPVCRALFFGTRNYAMEELIANFRKLKTLKTGGAATSGSSKSSTPAKENNSEPEDDNMNEEEDSETTPESLPASTPQSSKGLFRCLCCKNGNYERLPAARLLNHLRYYHRPDLLEGRTENGEYLQAWQIATTPGRLVTAIRIANMGIFFLIIEISSDSVFAWLSMAATPWVAHAFNYTVTICGNDREAIFSDCVWSVRSCEGSLKKRGHCLLVKDLDAQALTAPAHISTKLCIRRTPEDQLANQSQPRAVLRIANRVSNGNNISNNILQNIDNNITRLSQSLAVIDRQITAAIENEMNAPSAPARNAVAAQPTLNNGNVEQQPTLSRNARRRMRQRLRAALNGPAGEPAATAPSPHQERIQAMERQMQEIRNAFDAGDIIRNLNARAPVPPPGMVPVPPPRSSYFTPPQRSSNNNSNSSREQQIIAIGPLIVSHGDSSQASSPALVSVAPPGPSNGQAQNGNGTRPQKKKRRHRR